MMIMLKHLPKQAPLRWREVGGTLEPTTTKKKAEWERKEDSSKSAVKTAVFGNLKPSSVFCRWNVFGAMQSTEFMCGVSGQVRLADEPSQLEWRRQLARHAPRTHSMSDRAPRSFGGRIPFLGWLDGKQICYRYGHSKSRDLSLRAVHPSVKPPFSIHRAATCRRNDVRTN